MEIRNRHLHGLLVSTIALLSLLTGASSFAAESANNEETMAGAGESESTPLESTAEALTREYDYALITPEECRQACDTEFQKMYQSCYTNPGGTVAVCVSRAQNWYVTCFRLCG